MNQEAARLLRDRSQQVHDLSPDPMHRGLWATCPETWCTYDRDMIERLIGAPGHWAKVDAWLKAERERHTPDCRIRRFKAIGPNTCSCGADDARQVVKP